MSTRLQTPARQPARLVYIWDLLSVLVSREMKLRYRRSVLGIAWSLLNPLAQLLVFSLVFRYILPLKIPNYTSFLFAGLLVWDWFQAALLAGTGAIVDNRELIRRPGFPLGVLPVVITATHWIHFLLALPILAGFLLISGVHLSIALLLFLLPLFVIQFLFTLGLIYFLAAVHVTFRDTQYLLGIGLMLGFYLSPVLYDLSAVPVRFRAVFQLNPLSILISAYRDIFLYGTGPDLTALLALGMVSLGIIALGYRLYMHGSSMYMEEL